MHQSYTPSTLSKEAFADLKKIAKEECGDAMTDGEIEQMGVRLLKLFSLLELKKTDVANGTADLNERESKALAFIRDELVKGNKVPSVREIARAAGVRSSRSGYRLLHRLEEKQLIKLNQDTFIEPREHP